MCIRDRLKGYSPATPILDEPMDFNGYTPRNASDTYKGWITLRLSLIHIFHPRIFRFRQLICDHFVNKTHQSAPQPWLFLQQSLFRIRYNPPADPVAEAGFHSSLSLPHLFL